MQLIDVATDNMAQTGQRTHPRGVLENGSGDALLSAGLSKIVLSAIPALL
jgi:hypothetical protein